MSIILDAMGGDHAPAEIIRGALNAAPHLRHDLILVGVTAEIEKYLPHPVPSRIHIHPASEVIEMDDKPTDAMRKKRDSSMVVGVQLVKDGKGKVFISAGNTGAATAISLLSWRQMEGIHRPAIGSAIPSLKERFLLLDAGASPDIDPEHLVEFAIMGRSYVERMWNRPDPKVHLLNIGEEPGKGNAFAKQAFTLLAEHKWFRGNVESKDMYSGECDVVVCDAFVGNIVLKCAEGTAEMMIKLIRQEVPTSMPMKLFYAPIKKVMAPIRKRMDYAEVGGSPLLGLNELCIICHGRSNALAIQNAIMQAQQAIASGLNDNLRASIASELGK